MRLFISVLLCLGVASGLLVHAPSAQAKPSKRANASMAQLLLPNPGAPVSIYSGLLTVEPCSGAAPLGPTWVAAARRFNLRWQILAAITKVESGFGCNMGPSSAGALGWTQFMPETWSRWGMDGDGDGQAEPSNSVDAIYSAARYLRVTGAPQDYRKAIFAYNHANWYVDKVLATAEEFGQFKPHDHRQLAQLAQRGLELRQELSELEEQVEKSQEGERRSTAQLRQAKTRLTQSQAELEIHQREFGVARERLDQMTLDYIQLTQGVASAQHSSNPAGDMGMLQYVADSNPQDAVLVYQAARSILDQQATTLDELRSAAVYAQTLQSKVEALVAEREKLVEQRQIALETQRESLQQYRRSLSTAKRRMVSYQSTVRKYRSIYGGAPGEGSLLQGPFAGLQADQELEGEIRWPVTGPIVSKFSPNRCLAGLCRPHQGVDIAVPSDTAVRAPASGTVSTAGVVGGYGNMVCVEHGGGVSTCSAHLSTYRVAAGDAVKKGQVVGRSGCTGRCFGPHVHFEVRRSGSAVDPLRYLP